jgi:hypothetical protein
MYLTLSSARQAALARAMQALVSPLGDDDGIA